MSNIKEVKEQLGFKVTQDVYEKPTKEETIKAIKSVPSIPDPDRLIEQMDEKVRYIKGFKGLKEGVFNGIPFTDEVLKKSADTWNHNPHKPGIPYPVKLEHGKNIMRRAGHLLNTYYEDGWIKHDILLTTKAAAEQYDGGHLTDGSERVILGIDTENSTKKDIKLAYIKGTGIDFVDNPACKECGINPEMEKLLSELEEDITMSEEIEFSEEEKTFAEKLKKFLGLDKEEEKEEDELDEEEKELCGTSSAKSTKKKKKEEDEDEMDENEEEEEKLDNNETTIDLTKMTDEQKQELAEILGVTELKAQLEESRKNEAKLLHDKKVDAAMELHEKLGDEVKREELEKKEDAVLDERIEQLKIRASEKPAHDTPETRTVLSDEEKKETKKRNKELKEELHNKGFKK